MIEWKLNGHGGQLAARTWANPGASWLAVLVHGYGEHLGRYEHVARTLVTAGAVVIGADHIGHGDSAGERVLVTDFEQVVADVDRVIEAAGTEHSGLPVVLIGHSLGGAIAVRYAQQHPERLTAMVLSAPVLGSWHALDLLEYEQIPDTPIDPDTLSRDPAVGAAYAADPLVWHGPFKRETLRALDELLQTINFDQPLGDELPVLWLHGDEDTLVEQADTRAGTDRVRGLGFQEHTYIGARHELFNEVNKDEVLFDVVAFVREVLAAR
ncbi:alpha-beta hydrolase superfamily lysophospholipase [Kutzneria viridogrisea]|uniref:Lipase n=2 Tax=Kutzneria TaxID=43356 RepID=W5W0D5_9PSEU|nr:alpha/beta hydrolase [Kutzneria albida]AHH94026.1 lipase [Kutzneria albida DSM 43870]MBA8930968.1 alpha-beta hydrolase superfamily lysophospholipase [Kutzneria viridogrisea]